MATRAYILIEAKPGRAPHLGKTLRRVPEVESADVVTGSCDLYSGHRSAKFERGRRSGHEADPDNRWHSAYHNLSCDDRREV